MNQNQSQYINHIYQVMSDHMFFLHVNMLHNFLLSSCQNLMAPTECKPWKWGGIIFQDVLQSEYFRESKTW